MPRQSFVELLRDPDAALVAACRRPDSDEFESAFAALFQRYRDRVYAIAFRITGGQQDALDVVQESFALVFRKLDGFRGTSLFSTWLFRIVVNCSIDQRRRARFGNRLVLLGGEEHAVEDDSSGPRDRAAKREVSDQVQVAISQLSPKLRAILALRYLEEMSYEELAATLEVSMGTIKSRLARAHLALEHVVRARFPELAGELRLGGDTPGAAADASVGGVG